MQQITQIRLADIQTIPTDRSRPVRERLAAYCRAVGDPYFFRVGEIRVRIAFSENGKALSDQLSSALGVRG